jgi:three-Cys-motif partner protein
LEASLKAAIGFPFLFEVRVFSEEVATAAIRAMTLVDARYPSVWLLDPFTPEQLPWSVVEAVANFSSVYPRKGTGEPIIRRPELIITLMTHALQRNVRDNPKLVTTALGLAETQWRPTLDSYGQEGLNIREALIRLYCERLEEIYRKPPFALEVSGSSGNVIYAIIFCSSSDAGTYMAHMRVAKAYLAWNESSWKPKANLIAANKRIRRRHGKGAPVQTSLDPPDPETSYDSFEMGTGGN